jgi:hypothetical protein
MGAAYLADTLKKPIEMAVLYALIGVVLGVVSGASVGGLLLGAVFNFVFCAAYFLLLVRVSGQMGLGSVSFFVCEPFQLINHPT